MSSSGWVRTADGDTGTWLDEEQWLRVDDDDAPAALDPWDDVENDVTLTDSQRAFLRQVAEQGAPPRLRGLEDPLVRFDADPRFDDADPPSSEGLSD